MNKIPKLRFPEFSGEWEEKRSKDILTLKGGYAFKSDKFLNEKSIYQVIKMGNVYQNNLLLDKNPSYLSEITEREKEYLLKKGDVIITLTGTVGKRDFGYSFQINNEENLLLNQRLALLRANPNTSDNKFLRYILLKDQFLDQFFESSTGGTGNQANVSIKNMDDFRVTLPSIPEQKEIASFLSSVDSKIEKLERKKELWEQYKKGMMQKIFSQELRFRDENGEAYPEWEEKEFKELFQNIGGTALENFVTDDSDYKFISIGNYSKTGKYIDTKQRIILNEKTKQKLLNKNNLVMVLNDKTSTGDIIGSTILIEKNNSYIYNQRSERLICENDILPLYAWVFLNSDLFRKKIFSMAQGGTQIYVNFSAIKKTILNLPSLPEQTQIADFLSSLDSKIEIVEKELLGMKEFKKGLLQKMFV